MQFHARIIIAALAATIALALGTGAASASRSFSVVGGGRAVRGIGRGLTFTAAESGIQVIGDVTLTGSVHSLIGKTAGTEVATITRVDNANCRTNIGAECVAIGLLPASIRLTSFTGTLPRITGGTGTIEGGAQFQIGGTMRCLYRGPGSGFLIGRSGAAEFTVESIEPDRTGRITLFRAEGEEFFRRCPRTGTMAGRYTLSPSFTVRLH